MLLALACALLLLPKWALLAFSADVLSVRLDRADWLQYQMQDAALALSCWALLAWMLGRPGAGRLAAGCLGTGALLAVLLIDCRVRELWLHPLDLEVVRYGLASADDLASAHDLFFRQAAGFGITLRRMMVLAGAAHVALWAAIGLQRWRQARGHARAGAIRTPVRPALAAAALAFALLLGSAALAPAVYSLEQNIFVRPLVSLLRGSHAGTTVEARQLAGQFEQRVRPARELFGTPRRIAADAAPFTNLVLILFESLRWKGMALEAAPGSATPAPFLRRLASEGMLCRSYVSLPHSSKSYYSVLTGRHPWLGIEMIESMQPRSESLFWELAARRSATTYCFSTMRLSFEDLGGLLRSLGIGRRRQMGNAPVSSFGNRDELLLESVPELAASGVPFAAVYLPLAAHYPYDYPGKPPELGDGLEAYLGSVRHADGVLSRLVDSLGAAGLLRDTLLVVVGDHGESFGEHGTTVHNNSMYEEEVTSPLIFWSADGRLRTEGVRTARHIDIAPTALDLMGLTASGLLVQGHSLLRAETAGVAWISAFFDRSAQVRVEGSFKVIYLPGSGHMMSFDLAQDPEERHPAAVADPELRARLERQFAAHPAYQRSLFGPR